MQYQVLMVTQVLELAVAKAQDFVKVIPKDRPQALQKAELLVQAIQRVRLQALALSLTLQLAQEGVQKPLEGSLGQFQQGLEHQVQEVLAEVMAQAEAGGWAVAQAMMQVDQEQEQELIQAPLLEVE